MLLANHAFAHCQTGGRFDKHCDNDKFALGVCILPAKTRALLLGPPQNDEMRKMAGVTQEEAWFFFLASSEFQKQWFASWCPPPAVGCVCVQPITQRALRGKKMTPHCLAAIFDSQLPSQKFSLEMPPSQIQTASPPEERAFFHLSKLPRQ